MACNQLSAITFTCLDNTGGLSSIYVTNFSNVASYTTNSIGTITGLTMQTGTSFVQLQSTRDTSTFTEDETISIENGTNFFTQKVEIYIPRRDAAKRNSVFLLSSGQPQLIVIVTDLNGNSWLLGLTQGAYLMSNKGGTGKKKADANGYTLEIEAEEPSPAPVVDPYQTDKDFFLSGIYIRNEFDDNILSRQYRQYICNNIF